MFKSLSFSCVIFLVYSKVIQPKKKGKENRQWINSGSTKDMASYDYSNMENGSDGNTNGESQQKFKMDKEVGSGDVSA